MRKEIKCDILQLGTLRREKNLFVQEGGLSMLMKDKPKSDHKLLMARLLHGNRSLDQINLKSHQICVKF